MMTTMILDRCTTASASTKSNSMTASGVLLVATAAGATTLLTMLAVVRSTGHALGRRGSSGSSTPSSPSTTISPENHSIRGGSNDDGQNDQQVFDATMTVTTTTTTTTTKRGMMQGSTSEPDNTATLQRTTKTITPSSRFYPPGLAMYETIPALQSKLWMIPEQQEQLRHAIDREIWSLQIRSKRAFNRLFSHDFLSNIIVLLSL
jgi:hypothetical protein